jgi:putative oligomerization/nucleic acid binding protein
VKLGRWMLSISLGLLAVGCGPEAPSVRYSGTTLAAVHQPAQVKVYRGSPPDRPYQELGTVDVSCPTMAQGTGFGGVQVEGGCSYEIALQMATEQAARSGADGIYNIQTAAGGNGSVVSLTAVAVRFTGPPTAAAPAAEVAAWPTAAAKPSVNERLQHLKQLADQGLISADEYNKRKAEILQEL